MALTKSINAERHEVTVIFGVSEENETFNRVIDVFGGESETGIIINNNQVTWTSLDSGSQLNVTVIVEIGISSKTTVIDPDTGLSSTITVTTPKEITVSFSAYTQPDIFSWKGKDEGKLKGGPNGDIVNNSTFMNKWNDLCEVAGQYRSWRDQDNEYGDYDSCMYKKNQLMSASKFNIIATALDKAKSFQVKKDDLITAKLFNDLIQNVE